MKAALKYVGKSRYTLEDLKEIITILRAPDGCPWDREQTFDSLRSNTIEETYELADAITAHDMEAIKEELGDLLFSAVNVSRFVKVDAEEALTAASDKFLLRFTEVEHMAAERGIDMKTAGIETLDRLWDEAKLQK